MYHDPTMLGPAETAITMRERGSPSCEAAAPPAGAPDAATTSCTCATTKKRPVPWASKCAAARPMRAGGAAARGALELAATGGGTAKSSARDMGAVSGVPSRAL